MIKTFAAVISILVASILPSQAMAYDWMVEANVTLIEPTYMPDRVVFKLNAAAGSCAAGSNITWFAKGSTAAEKEANANAILSTLITARVANLTVRVHGNNATCTVDFLHLI